MKDKRLVIGGLVAGAVAILAILVALLMRPGAEATPATTGTRAASSLQFDSLMNGFSFDGPADESTLTPPENAAPPAHVFEGRLELLGEKDGGRIQVLRGELGPEYAYLPEFDFEFVQSDGYLIPTRRGLIVADHPQWNLHLEPGRAWQEAGDGEFSRASLPFALTVKGTNATFNGTLTFLFDDQRISKVWYQVTQETTTYTQANLWGLLEAAYHPALVAGAEQLRADFAAELAARLPVKPIEALAQDYPGVDVSAFGRGVTPEHMTWYGVVVNGVNYLGGCQTRFGVYPYCESMRASSYSTAKSAFVSVALMRLAQQYGPEVADLLVRAYVPEYAASPGDWEQVTFDHVIDMSSGNYVSAGFMADDDSDKMGEFFAAQPYAERIKAAFDCPHAAEPGRRWVYLTSDTFILTRALHNYLQTQEGPQADIFQFVVDEVYRPLGLGPGAYSTMRTADDDWQGQAEGGYGLWWIPDDVAKIAVLLNDDGGAIDGVQVLQPDLLAAALQRDPNDRGVRIDGRRMYNDAFWANRYSQADGFDCEFWVPQMLGVSGNVVALMPNGVTYYYFSDNQEFTWDAALREADKIVPLCRSAPPTSTALPQPTRTPLPPSPTPIPATATPTAAPSTAWVADFATFLDGLASEDEFSGAVLIAKDEEVLLKEAYGLADRALDVPNRIDTKFNLGSMNKMFTAIAIMQLAEAGKLSVEDTILQHLPDYPNSDVARQVTIDHLLTHTSGLGDVFTEPFAANPHHFRSNADYLPLFVDEPLQFEPGERFSYSNAGYVVLGLLIEQVSGQSYDAYIQQHVYDPSGMVDSGAFEIDADTPNLAVGYTTLDFWGNETGTLTSNSALMPGKGFAAGGGYSTVEDLLRFRDALLGFRLLSAESTEVLLSGKVTIGQDASYAYGFLDRRIAGQRVIGHSGGAPGVESFLNIYPASGYTFVVLSNSDHAVPVLEYLETNPAVTAALAAAAKQALPTPTAVAPIPAGPESAAGTVAFADSGQELGHGRSTDVALGDLDGDGDLDAMVGNEGQAQVWLNDGHGSFAPNGQNLTISSGWRMGLDLGDLDGDDDLDAFIVVAEGPGRVLLNQGGAQGETAGSFVDSGQQLVAASGFGFDLDLGDVDGDGDLDAYVAHERANLVWLNDGQGGFQDSGQRLGQAITADVALADLDGDGDLDALVGGWDEPARVWLNDGQGTFADSGRVLTAAAVHIHGLDVGDLDGDGDLDVFLALASGDPNQVWFNDGQAVFSDSGQQLPSALGHAVVLGDLDGDGDLDAFVANAVSSAGAPNTVWLNDGQGSLSDSGLRLGNGLSYGVDLGDLDGDGDLDAFVANNSSPNAVWLNERY